MKQKDMRLAEYWRLKKLKASYLRFLLDLGSTFNVFLVPVLKWLKGCRGLAVALSTSNDKYKETIKTFLIFLAHLIQPPDITELILLVLALDDLHFVLYRLLMKHGADEIRDEP